MGVNVKPGLAVAVDVGTTTIAACALERASGKVIAASGAPNPQSAWGPDVLSRIEAISSDPGKLEEMAAALAVEINSLVRRMVDPVDVQSVAIAGNTVMEHIFARVSPVPIAKVPYKPVFKDAKTLDAKDTGIDAGQGAGVYLFPSIGGFVGGDAVAVMLALGFGQKKEVALAIDIGTNSEIMLCADGTSYATSAAAGPAFEAGGIGSGMTAARGAIEGVSITDDEVNLKVIGGVKPVGICGSGVISAVAAMLGAGVMERGGRIKDRVELDTNIGNRIKNDVSGNAFTLYRAPGIEISLTQNDIRNLQNAKAAIRAGVSIILAKAAITADDVDKVYIAGAFGSKLDPKDLAAIGVLEKAWMEKAEAAGDGALDGVVLALSSDKQRARAEELARSTKYVSLSGSAHFEKEFLRHMGF